jgi:hypothetical protein
MLMMMRGMTYLQLFTARSVGPRAGHATSAWSHGDGPAASVVSRALLYSPSVHEGAEKGSRDVDMGAMRRDRGRRRCYPTSSGLGMSRKRHAGRRHQHAPEARRARGRPALSNAVRRGEAGLQCRNVQAL